MLLRQKLLVAVAVIALLAGGAAVTPLDLVSTSHAQGLAAGLAAGQEAVVVPVVVVVPTVVVLVGPAGREAAAALVVLPGRPQLVALAPGG